MRRTFARWRFLAVLVVAGLAGLGAAPNDDDSFQWLEDVRGEKALAWAKEQSAQATKVLEARPEYKPIYKRTLEILDSKEKIPTPETPRRDGLQLLEGQGARRRPVAAHHASPSTARPRPAWETVLDLDALNASEKAELGLARRQLPAARPTRGACVALSRGGADADRHARVRPGRQGLRARTASSCPRRRARVGWRDADTLYVGTDFGPGSMTTSGYPRIVKLWKRGTPLSAAKTVFEGETKRTSARLGLPRLRAGLRARLRLARLRLLRQRDCSVVGKDGKQVQHRPAGRRGASACIREWLTLQLREPLGRSRAARPTRAAACSPTNFDAFMQGKRDWSRCCSTPTPTASLASAAWTRDFLHAQPARGREEPHRGAVSARRRLGPLGPGDAGGRRRRSASCAVDPDNSNEYSETFLPPAS